MARTGYEGTLRNRFAAFGRAVTKYGTLADSLQTLEKHLVKYDNLAARITQIHEQVCKEIVPEIRSALARSFAASGIKSDTGALYSACVTNADVRATPRGIRIGMQAQVRAVNKDGTARDIYGQAGALEFGAIRPPKGEKKLKNKTLRSTFYATATRGYGQKSKRLGGYVEIQARPFFNLDGSIGGVELRYVTLFQNHVNKILGAA